MVFLTIVFRLLVLLWDNLSLYTVYININIITEKWNLWAKISKKQNKKVCGYFESFLCVVIFVLYFFYASPDMKLKNIYIYIYK